MQADVPGERRWDIPRVKADLNHEDDEARLITIENVGRHFPEVTEAVNVLRIALTAQRSGFGKGRRSGSRSLGGRVAAEAIDRFEMAVLKRRQQDDLAIRILLLGYYYDHTRSSSDAIREARQVHVLWVIEHAPRSFVAGTPYATLSQYRDGEVYQQGREMWMKLVEDHPEDTVILNNAAGFLLLSDEAMSEELLKRAQSLEPDDPIWSRRLGDLYRLGMIGTDAAARRTLAAKVQAEYERAQGLYRDERERLDQLHLLAEAAFEAGDHAGAVAYASELLSSAGPGHRNIFYANQVLGRLALVEGDVERARSHLLASAETAGGPLWCSTFRCMMLAGELLDRGERETVRRFLERCSESWPKSAKWLTDRAAAIERR